MSYDSLPKPDAKPRPASWMSALTVNPKFKPVESESPRWPTAKELIDLVHELFREGSLDLAQMRVLATLPELAQPSLDAKATILPAE